MGKEKQAEEGSVITPSARLVGVGGEGAAATSSSPTAIRRSCLESGRDVQVRRPC